MINERDESMGDGVKKWNECYPTVEGRIRAGKLSRAAAEGSG
jgi:hypothetical protein